MSVNRLLATSERDAELQLEALYKAKPIKTGASRLHQMTWFVKSRRATMAKRSSHQNGRKERLYLVEVK